MTKAQRTMRLISLGMISASVVSLPYIQYKFYDTLMQATQTTNQQLSYFLIALIITTLLFSAPVAIIAEKTSYVKTIFISIMMHAILNIYFSFHHTFVTGMVVWALLGVFYSFMGPLVKLVRTSAGPEDQGKMFGFFYAANGLSASIIGAFDVWMFSLAETPLQGFYYVLYTQAAFCVIAGIMLLIFVKDKTEFSESNEEVKPEEKSSMGLFKAALKLRATWVLALFVIFVYGAFTSLGYLTPYTTNVLGVSLAFGAVLGTIRQYFLRVAIGPIAGYLVDILGSASKVIGVSLVCMIVLLVVLMKLPPTTTMTIFIALIMIFSSFGQVLYIHHFTVLEEIHVPQHLTATVVGIVASVAYLPDAIFPLIFGYLLDTYGMVEGYKMIFYFLIVVCLIALFLAYRIIVANKKQKEMALATN